jgi:hypothetical protein
MTARKVADDEIRQQINAPGCRMPMFLPAAAAELLHLPAISAAIYIFYVAKYIYLVAKIIYR